MEQTWALGTAVENPREIEIVTDSGVRRVIPIEQATKLGVPKPAKAGRYVYEGDFASWRTEPADAYLAGLGFPESPLKSRHQVFTFEVSPALTAHVPALVLMRAFFKPHYCVLPVIFRPASLDMISFVDYGQDPPTVVLDNVSQVEKFNTRRGAHRTQAIQWCQLSLSARKMTWSVYRNALDGRLAMALPTGQTRFVLHGVRRGGDLFVTQAALSRVFVPAEDSLTKSSVQYVFHASVDPNRKRAASAKGLSVPTRPDGGCEVSDEEWGRLEPELSEQTPSVRPGGYPRRELLDLMLLKLARGIPWDSLPEDRKLVNAVKYAFRQWTMDGRLGVALGLLTAARSRHAATVA